ncbi:MAG: helix-turn-helix transcriptional regulator [Clostridia bacterium]|nr:helix-turn-helix transcriptional regulator [Clostridia bacterium]
MANYELSNRIYELRTQKGLSQKELGAILGVSNKAVSKWETGTAIPKTETLIKLAEVFEISTEELLNVVCQEERLPTLAELSKHVECVIEQKRESYEKEKANDFNVRSARVYLVGLIAIFITSVILSFYYIINGGEPIDNFSLGSYGEAIILADSVFAIMILLPLLLCGVYTGIFGFFKIAKHLPWWACVLCGILILFLFGIMVIVGVIAIIPLTVYSIKTIKKAKGLNSERT